DDFVPWDHPSPFLDAIGGVPPPPLDPRRLGFVVAAPQGNRRGLLPPRTLPPPARVPLRPTPPAAPPPPPPPPPPHPPRHPTPPRHRQPVGRPARDRPPRRRGRHRGRPAPPRAAPRRRHRHVLHGRAPDRHGQRAVPPARSLTEVSDSVRSHEDRGPRRRHP